mmetsp:Transcript_15234/g.20797  ORF Transcript_15234/g.20797 Transcript_15234/m.20797 type:complete len:389 (-) Transcript_15234:378-1544(-)|eukprot:CAMPEP_0185740736 /NCGR_PEP_ID=MMETSP1171-20130828/38497_1 /TAXON_ID=374046 /ORGANISM="Helicotheca tamensis, Strain CCMP826" /LENGTH=388 /DNA_ID=CAMNT_0028412651 /DNA_START=84 /DNA_END=1250 /DNA_ORIENTATION=+
MAKDKRDPRAPKRNLSAYLLYQNAMRETFKLQNPGMTFGQLAKYTSAMYSEMPQNEKDSWHARAEMDKARYLHELNSYVPPPGYDAKGDAIVGSNKGARSKGKLVKDAKAPKKNMSAYLLYQNAMRDPFKQENPGMTFGQLAKYTSHMYKSLTPDEKAQWEARAHFDKERYDQQMAQYVPPPGHNAQGVLIDDSKYARKQKKPKDPNCPKRARGSFVFFTFEMRPKILQEFPGIKFVEMGTLMGERWRALPPEEKKRFEDMAAADKARFNNEMQKYNAERGVSHQEIQAVNQHVQAHQPHMDPHYPAMALPQAPVPAPQIHHEIHEPSLAAAPQATDPNPVYNVAAVSADPNEHAHYSDPAALASDPAANVYGQQIPDAQQTYDQQVY